MALACVNECGLAKISSVCVEYKSGVRWSSLKDGIFSFLSGHPRSNKGLRWFEYSSNCIDEGVFTMESCCRKPLPEKLENCQLCCKFPINISSQRTQIHLFCFWMLVLSRFPYFDATNTKWGIPLSWSTRWVALILRDRTKRVLPFPLKLHTVNNRIIAWIIQIS